MKAKHDLKTHLLIRKRDFDLSIESAGTKEGGVESVRSVGGHDDLHLPQRVESVHLVEQLHQCALNFTIRRCSLGESATA